MKRNRTIAIIYYILAVLFYIIAIINIFDKTAGNMGIYWLCLGSVWLCLGSLFLHKSQNNDGDSNSDDE